MASVQTSEPWSFASDALGVVILLSIFAKYEFFWQKSDSIFFESFQLQSLLNLIRLGRNIVNQSVQSGDQSFRFEGKGVVRSSNFFRFISHKGEKEIDVKLGKNNSLFFSFRRMLNWEKFFEMLFRSIICGSFVKGRINSDLHQQFFWIKALAAICKNIMQQIANKYSNFIKCLERPFVHVSIGFVLS